MRNKGRSRRRRSYGVTELRILRLRRLLTGCENNKATARQHVASCGSLLGLKLNEPCFWPDQLCCKL
eukprot:8092544-Pyramimonas_sp.AAC.1